MINWTTLIAAKSTVGSIRNYVNRDDIPAENILIEAEAWIYERLRVREMQSAEAFTFLISTNSLPLPSGFLDPIQLLPYGWADPLMFWHEERFIIPRTTAGALYSGTPCGWTIIGETAYVDVSCAAAFPCQMMFYKRPAALSASNLTNFLTIRYPTLLRQACMYFAYEHMKDSERAIGYMNSAMAQLGAASQTNEMSRRTQHVPY